MKAGRVMGTDGVCKTGVVNNDTSLCVQQRTRIKIAGRKGGVGGQGRGMEQQEGGRERECVCVCVHGKQ